MQRRVNARFRIYEPRSNKKGGPFQNSLHWVSVYSTLVIVLPLTFLDLTLRGFFNIIGLVFAEAEVLKRLAETVAIKRENEWFDKLNLGT